MTKRRSNNPSGRPKAYQGKMRMVAVSLPEPLIAMLDHIADDAGVARQRLIVETLLLAVTLNQEGYVWTDSEGTHFAGPFNKTNLRKTPRTPPTAGEMVEHYSKLARMAPEMAHLPGVAFTITRDAVFKQPGEEEEQQDPREYLRDETPEE